MSNEQLKSAVYLMVAQMVERKMATMGSDVAPVIATPSFTAALVELVYNQIVNTGADLELFATHAGRSVVEPADLYMVARKNPVLTKVLKQFEINEGE
ncbi:inner kinetochore subunit Mhf1p [Diutina catenulata]